MSNWERYGESPTEKSELIETDEEQELELPEWARAATDVAMKSRARSRFPEFTLARDDPRRGLAEKLLEDMPADMLEQTLEYARRVFEMFEMQRAFECLRQTAQCMGE